ncbi:hypothetical protein DFJ77DRAFT_195891 [Powellomyces hirtus]|nr:hypothetical protein DFJ77DRAFT_195891 [Powellomyces hirtus]
MPPLSLPAGGIPRHVGVDIGISLANKCGQSSMATPTSTENGGNLLCLSRLMQMNDEIFFTLDHAHDDNRPETMPLGSCPPVKKPKKKKNFYRSCTTARLARLPSPSTPLWISLCSICSQLDPSGRVRRPRVERFSVIVRHSKRTLVEHQDPQCSSKQVRLPAEARASSTVMEMNHLRRSVFTNTDPSAATQARRLRRHDTRAVPLKNAKLFHSKIPYLEELSALIGLAALGPHRSTSPPSPGVCTECQALLKHS